MCYYYYYYYYSLIFFSEKIRLDISCDPKLNMEFSHEIPSLFVSKII